MIYHAAVYSGASSSVARESEGTLACVFLRSFDIQGAAEKVIGIEKKGG